MLGCVLSGDPVQSVFPGSLETTQTMEENMNNKLKIALKCTKYSLVSFLCLGFLFTICMVSDSNAQSLSDCDSFSDVRPSPTSMSPRELCQCEMDSSYCIVPSETVTSNQSPQPKPSCTNCGSCSIPMIFGAQTIFTTSYGYYEDCVSNLSDICGVGEYSHCYIKYSSRWRFIGWSLVKVRNASCRSK